MKAKSYTIAVPICIIILAIVVTVVFMLDKKSDNKEDESVRDKPVITVTELEPPVIVNNKINENAVPRDLDLDEQNEYKRSLIDYSGKTITVTPTGFTLEDAFAWSGDTAWFDAEEDGHAAYDYLWLPICNGESITSNAVDDALNIWTKENLDYWFDMAAALECVDTEEGAEWYVVYEEHPETLLRCYYNKNTEECRFEKLFPKE